MTSAEIWTLILGLGAATYLIRLSFLGLMAGREVPAPMRRALGFVPVTVLPAITAPMLFLEDGALTGDPARLAGALAGIVVGIAFRHMVGALVAAMATYLAITALVL
ncbi:MAG: AzlD domain-containing protein [Pseudomonadota bacterium]